jgi:putative chitinase
MAFKFNFTENHVRVLLPRNKEPRQWFKAMSTILPLWDINTPLRVAGFIAQTAYESSDYRMLYENLNYSATRLNRVFPKYFRRAGRDATQYHRQPEKIANVVYANRMDNGDISSGDGWRYRGRGIIQLTGKYNYTQFARAMDMDLDIAVDYVSTKEGALDSACWFWDSRRLNEVADRGDIDRMTKLVNGGYHGKMERAALYRRALRVFDSTNESTDKITRSGTAIPSSTHSTVSIGSRGDTVVALQRALNINADGIFGRGTASALKNWQAANGLVPDGVAGPNTLKKLLG